MKKNTYPFARLFIRLAVILALLVFISGIGLALNAFLMMQSQLAEVKYQPDPTLEQQAKNLEKSYLGTQKRVLRSLDATAFPQSVKIVDFQSTLPLAQKSGDMQKANVYYSLAEETSSSIEAIKEYHIAEFVNALRGLQKTLLENAAKLRTQYAQKSQNQQAALPQQTTPSTQTTNNSSKEGYFRIYIDAPQQDQSRFARIKEIKAYLDSLSATSAKDESRDQLRRASIYLARAESLLDFLDKKNEDTNPQIQNQAATMQEQEAQLVSKSERVAQELDQIITVVQESLYSDWVAQRDAQKLESDAKLDLTRAKKAKDQAKTIQLSSIQLMAMYLIASMALAFIIMVVADFMSAFLNLSNNSDTLVINTNK
jgi:hypothetical protein